MSTNSIRISTQTFEMARAQGELMSRSAAQQVEHWARLGAALEASGMTVAEMEKMLRGDASDAGMWAEKRARQARDLEAVRSGRVSGEKMSWFSADMAKQAKLVDSPY